MDQSHGTSLSAAPASAPERRDVFLLGAGFSKAISNSMPLMIEMSQAILSVVDDDRTKEQLTKILGSKPDFERALSYLSEAQPWISEAHRLRNRALFYDLADAIYRVITSAQSRAIQDSLECPQWLLHLVLWMQRSGASIITLNYDTLLESAFLELSTPDHPSLSSWDFRPFTVLPDANYTGNPEDPGIKLLKLHGSVHWSYSGSAHFYGESIRDRWIHRWSLDSQDARTFPLDDGRVPLIIPPTFNKNRYFENEKIKHQWGKARIALGSARRIFCVGYGMPAGDSLMHELLNDAASQHDFDAPFFVVNKNPTIIDRYSAALPPTARIEAAYVRQEDEVTQDFVQALTSGKLDANDRYRPSRASCFVREKIQSRCPSGSVHPNAVTGESIRVGRIDDYGIVIPNAWAHPSLGTPGTRYVVWEIVVTLLRQLADGKFDKYFIPALDYPRILPFDGDAALLSLLRCSGLVEDYVEGNNLRFRVAQGVPPD